MDNPAFVADDKQSEGSRDREASVDRQPARSAVLLSLFFVVVTSTVCLWVVVSLLPQVDRRITLINFGHLRAPREIEESPLSGCLNAVERTKTRIDNSLTSRFPFCSRILLRQSRFDLWANRSMYDAIGALARYPYPARIGRFITRDGTFLDVDYNRRSTSEAIRASVVAAASACAAMQERLPTAHVAVFAVDDYWTHDLIHGGRDDYLKLFAGLVADTVAFDGCGVRRRTEGSSSRPITTGTPLVRKPASHGYRRSLPAPAHRSEIRWRYVSVWNSRGVRFQGSNVRTAATTGFSDPFHDCVADGAPATLRVNDELVTWQLSEADAYRAGRFDDSPFVDHYGRWFHPNYAKLHYSVDANRGNGNLLAVEDSLGNSNQALIASSYRECHFVDPRLYDAV